MRDLLRGGKAVGKDGKFWGQWPTYMSGFDPHFVDGMDCRALGRNCVYCVGKPVKGTQINGQHGSYNGTDGHDCGCSCGCRHDCLEQSVACSGCKLLYCRLCDGKEGGGPGWCLCSICEYCDVPEIVCSCWYCSCGYVNYGKDFLCQHCGIDPAGYAGLFVAYNYIVDDSCPLVWANGRPSYAKADQENGSHGEVTEGDDLAASASLSVLRERFGSGNSAWHTAFNACLHNHLHASELLRLRAATGDAPRPKNFNRENMSLPNNNNAPAKGKKKKERHPRVQQRAASAPRREKKKKGPRTITFQGMAQESAEVATGTFVKNNKPKFRTTKDGVVVAHREMFRRVLGSAAWSTDTYRIQPGIGGSASLWQWLPQIAVLFEYYIVRSLRLVYVASCPSTTTGNLWCVVDYDNRDIAVTGPTQASSTNQSISMVPWSTDLKKTTVRMDPKCIHARKQALFVTTDAWSTFPLSGFSVNDYDGGFITIAREKGTDAATWGDLYVEYVIEFKAPQGIPASTPFNTGITQYITLPSWTYIFDALTPGESTAKPVARGGATSLYPAGLSTAFLTGLTSGMSYFLSMYFRLDPGYDAGLVVSNPSLVGGTITRVNTAGNAGGHTWQSFIYFTAVTTVTAVTWLVSSTSGIPSFTAFDMFVAEGATVAALTLPEPRSARDVALQCVDVYKEADRVLARHIRNLTSCTTSATFTDAPANTWSTAALRLIPRNSLLSCAALNGLVSS
jgi:hypothetical protein